MHQSGTKTFILKKRTVNNRQTKITIGRFGDLTIDQARKLAVGHANELIKGNDPSQSKHNARDIPRFDDFAKRYLAEHCEVKNKPTTLRSNKSVIEKILIKRFGAMPISKFGHDEVVKLRNSMRHIPYRANRAIALLRHMMNWAEQLGYRPPHTNPCPKGRAIALPPKACRVAVSTLRSSVRGTTADPRLFQPEGPAARGSGRATPA